MTWATERDGRAVAHAQLARTCEALGLREDAQLHGREAQVQFGEFTAHMDRLKATLAEAQLERLYPVEPAGQAAAARGTDAAPTGPR
jgi:hypothetical protein